MKITKERARSPLIADGICAAAIGYDAGKITFDVSCRGTWVQGKGHLASYTMHLTKEEALYVMREWLSQLHSIERAAKRSEETARLDSASGDR